MAEELLEFEDVTVDLKRLVVCRGGQPVALEPKTFDVLRHLLLNRDRLVTKEELLDVVWKDTFVTPNVLTRAVAQLRKALGDDAFEARYVETVSRRGYRFIAPVEVRHEAAASAPGAVPQERPSVPPPPPRFATFPRWVGTMTLGAVLLVGAGFGVYALRERTAESFMKPAAQLSPRRFTTGGRSYSFPAISPDGRTVVYSVDQNGSTELYTLGFAPGSNEAALTNDGGQNMLADWSPDGQWIAYHSRRKGGIWIVPSAGGPSRQVADFGSHPAWTPDGQHIVFTSDAGGMAAQSLIWIVHRDGTDARQITKLGSPRGGHTRPAVSPDGRYVAFAVSQGHMGFEIWLASLDGSKSSKLASGSSPRFSSDGKALYWIGHTPEGNDVLMKVALAEGAPAGAPLTLQTFTGSFLRGFSIARNEGTAVLWLNQLQANLWSVEVPARGVGRVAALTSDDVRTTQPRHSTQGRIVFSQLATGSLSSPWVMDEDGRNREPLAVGFTSAIVAPQWMPDGKRVFVHAGREDRGWSFAWLDTATRQLTTIPASANGALSPNLSPDGREVAFHVIDQRGVINVWTQPLDGGPRRQVTFDGEAMSYPVWAPDGRSIAVEVKRGDSTQIGLVPRDGGDVEMLVTERGQNWPYSWAPDNDRLAFAGSRDGVWNIYSVSRSTKEIRQLTAFTSIEGYVRYPSWSRTQNAVVFERAEERGSLWSVRLP